MQTELHSPGAEIWEAAVATRPRLKSVSFCLQSSAALEVILRAAFHVFCSSSSLLSSTWQRSSSRQGWSQRVAGQEDSLPWADAQLCWAAGAQLLVEGMKAAGKRQKGKALTGKKRSNRMKKSLINYWIIPGSQNCWVLWYCYQLLACHWNRKSS